MLEVNTSSEKIRKKEVIITSLKKSIFCHPKICCNQLLSSELKAKTKVRYDERAVNWENEQESETKIIH